MNTSDIINKIGKTKENLLSILIEVQNNNEYHYITEEDIKAISNELEISESKVISTISFYTLLSTKPRGKNIIQVCSNVVCYVNDAINVVAEFEKQLGIKIGETTPDKMFTLEYTSCIGHCEKAPAIRINGHIYGRLDANKINNIIREYGGR